MQAYSSEKFHVKRQKISRARIRTNWNSVHVAPMHGGLKERAQSIGSCASKGSFDDINVELLTGGMGSVIPCSQDKPTEQHEPAASGHRSWLRILRFI